MEAMQKDIKRLKLTVDMTEVIREWRRRARVAYTRGILSLEEAGRFVDTFLSSSTNYAGYMNDYFMEDR